MKLLGQIDGQTANLFRVLCSLAVSLRNGGLIIDARVPSLGGEPGSNALLKYGLSYGQLTILHEYGLITPDYNSQIPFDHCIANEGRVAIAFTYGNSAWALVPSQERVEGRKLVLKGVSLSRSGKELLGIVDLAPNDEYTAALKQFFVNQKLTMVEARSGSPA